MGILVLIPITASQIAVLPSPPLPPIVLSAVAALQPLFLLVAGALTGARLGPKLGLRSLVAERASGLGPDGAHLRGIPALVGGSIVLGFIVNVADALALPLWLPAGTAWPAYEDAWSPVTLAFGMLYGGLTEEVTFRWGLMSFLVWAAWRLGGRRPDHSWALAIGILLSAIIFAAGHLPVIAAVMPLSAGPVLRTLAFNSLVGLWLGWIFARWHLEAAMVSHAAIHVGFALYALAMLAIG